MKYKELGKMLSKDEMKNVVGGYVPPSAYGCVVMCCTGYYYNPDQPPTGGGYGTCASRVPIAIETCNDIPWGCWLPESPCTCAGNPE